MTRVDAERRAPMRVLVVDDEPLARDCIRLAIADDADVQVIAECGDAASAVRAIEQLAPDLVFLDIQMPDGDGFDVLARVGPDRMPPVIVVTAYDRYALQAFEVCALDYVLKPFDDARLKAAIARARQRMASEHRSELGTLFLALLRDRGLEPERAAGFARRIMVEGEDDRIRFIAVEAVEFLEAEGNYVRVHTGQDEHRIRGPLTSVIERLDPARFVRIHRSTVVNVDRIREVQPWFGGDFIAILRDGRQLRVSRRYRSALLGSTL